jgi:hypothetical protein
MKHLNREIRVQITQYPPRVYPEGVQITQYPPRVYPEGVQITQYPPQSDTPKGCK